jgi:iron complex transport system ATP-binding protein
VTEERAVAIDGVTAIYAGSETPGAPALQGVTLEAAGAQVTALLGANGAGKSTLLRVAAGLLAPRAGSARIFGEDVAGMEPRRLAQCVALVAQSEAAPEGFLVREVVAMGRAPHQGGWMRERDEDRAAVDEAIARCDLAHLAARRVETLSGGEQRRVAVARGLAARPRVLLLDEPAAFLDVRHRLELHDLLAGVVARDRIACVVSTHDLDAAARLADHVVLMRAGRVVAAGPPADVMTAALLRETFDVDVDVGVHAASGQRYFVALRAAPTPSQAQRA